MSRAFEVVRDFELALSELTGAPYVVTTNSCTNALMIALACWNVDQHKKGGPAAPLVLIPKRTYVGVPIAAAQAGCRVEFVDQWWLPEGRYRIWPTPVVDSARTFGQGMYRAGTLECLSFHWHKPLGLQQGGAILHDRDDWDEWLRRARFDGRKEGVPIHLDTIQWPAWHCYLSPEIASLGLQRIAGWHTKDRVISYNGTDYPDLSTMEAFG